VIQQNRIDHDKENFQLERIALFSDSVFAIAVTLLIIEIKVPEIPKATDDQLINYLFLIIPKFIGFFVSFFVIGLYWMAHHRLFRYVVHSNQKLLWSNLLFLLPIIIMPFSTSFLSEYYSGDLKVPFAVYLTNISMAGYFSFRLWRVVGNPKYHLSSNLNNIIIRYNSVRALIIPFVFLIVVLFSFINSWISYAMLPFLPVVSKLVKRHFTKKYPDAIRTHLE
jgi:uncharacterized membrane protein